MVIDAGLIALGNVGLCILYTKKVQHMVLQDNHHLRAYSLPWLVLH